MKTPHHNSDNELHGEMMSVPEHELTIDDAKEWYEQLLGMNDQQDLGWQHFSKDM